MTLTHKIKLLVKDTIRCADDIQSETMKYIGNGFYTDRPEISPEAIKENCRHMIDICNNLISEVDA